MMKLSAEQEAAFTGIVNRYYEKILKFCYYALGGDQAEDCAQDIFLILYEKMGGLRDYDRIGGWLYKTAGNVSKQYAASRRNEREKFAAPSVNFAAGGDGVSLLDCIAAKSPIKSEEERIAEERAIAWADGEIRKRLKGDNERVLELAFRQKQPLAEVAARLGISLGAAKSRVSRLRQRINALARELLEDWTGVYHGAKD
ncbi:MAG: sigma-70 family RNA polymerase sigma factor [Spirochaetaceae bacterium]|jgi:RNA polymerase sigma-70 factor (ECF subfamily)|nr:sigma-70 family RNA polymerase sigma factor [Spirochaetaceae bacterium]